MKHLLETFDMRGVHTKFHSNKSYTIQMVTHYRKTVTVLWFTSARLHCCSYKPAMGLVPDINFPNQLIYVHTLQ